MKKKDKKQEQGMALQENAAPGVKKKKRNMAPVIIGAVVVLFVVVRVAGCALTPAAAVVVTTVQAQRGDLQDSISTSGTVDSEETEIVFASVSGKLGEVNVAAGDAVSAGDVLVNYDMEEMERTLQQAALNQQKSTAVYNGAMADNSENQAKLTEANTNLEVLDQQIADNKSYLKDLQKQLSQSQRDTSNGLANESYQLTNRLNDLNSQLSALGSPGDPGYDAAQAQALSQEIQSVNAQISRNSYLQSVATSTDYHAELQEEITDVQERIADYEEYRAEMESQKTTSENSILDAYDRESYSADKQLADLTYQQAEQEYYEAKQGIRAEFDGIVTECSVVSGATVTDGEQLLTLKSSQDLKVTFQASRYDLEKLEVGQKAEITISDHMYEGEVSKINRMATLNESNTPMVGVEIHITNPDDRIVLGLDAKLVIYTQKAEDVLLIPVEAINADKDGDFLYVVENGVVVKKSIVCGISTDTYSEVTEGITQEDQIILSSYATIEEGMAVTAVPAQ